MIQGFRSANDPPSLASAPTPRDPEEYTVSAFCDPDWTGPKYVRLVKFELKDCFVMFTRFNLYPGSSTSHPMLAMGNDRSKVFFWDLARVEEHHDYIEAREEWLQAREDLLQGRTKTGPGPEPKRPDFLKPFQMRNRGGPGGGGRASHPIPRKGKSRSRRRDRSPKEGDDDSGSETGNEAEYETGYETGYDSSEVRKGVGRKKEDIEKSMANWRKRYANDDPLVGVELDPKREEGSAKQRNKGLEPHYEELSLSKLPQWFTGRQCAWSVGGEWCVVVGTGGTIVLFQRGGSR